jgi:hypothetical protein
MDGTPAESPSVALEGIELPVVLSATRVVDAAYTERTSRVESCLREDWNDRPSGAVVHRIGAFGESVTFRNGSSTGLYGCDDGRRRREADRRWCGHVYGRLSGGLLHDPRLDLGCSTNDGRAVAFAWVSPGPRTRFVVVHHDGFAEAYRLAARLPVRVATTSRIDTAGSRATFELSEHDSDGRRLRAYALEARVAG